jgi:hypothetical protein
MKKIVAISLLQILTISGWGFAEEIPAVCETLTANRFYFGPEVLKISDHGHGQDASYKTHATYTGLNVGYDDFRVNHTYWGIEALYGIGEGHMNVHPYDAYRYGNNYRYQSIRTVLNGEARFGHNLEIKRNLLFTPFIGAGWYHFQDKALVRSWTYSRNYVYVTAGIKSDYCFNDIFHVGLNLKLLRIFFWNYRVKNTKKSGGFRNGVIGYEFGLPIAVHLGACRKWDLQFEPFFLKLDAQYSEKIIGARLNCGYWF